MATTAQADGQAADADRENREGDMIGTIFSCGYGNRAPDEFLKLLKDAGITLVIDVRREGSKSWCGAYRWGCGNGFGGMANLLGAGGIKYSTHPELANQHSTLAAYQAWLDTWDGGLASSGLYALIEVLWQDEVVCLVCAEKYPYKDGEAMCHRVLLADELLSDFGESWGVVHL